MNKRFHSDLSHLIHSSFCATEIFRNAFMIGICDDTLIMHASTNSFAYLLAKFICCLSDKMDLNRWLKSIYHPN